MKTTTKTLATRSLALALGCVIVLAGAPQALATFATGGTITLTNGYRVHTFTSVGTSNLTVTIPGSVEVLIVAGGGGGGDFGGGGGAGGFLTNAAYTVSGGSIMVTVGDGGAGTATPGTTGTKGQNSVFDVLTAYGGGGGGSRLSTGTPLPGLDGAGGGSGGGGSPSDGTYQGKGGAATNGQGNAGGNGPGSGNWGWGGGGGGGAGAAGAAANANNAGAGGVGLVSAICGSNVTYAGGGGGTTYTGGSGTVGAGGAGGGGAGGKGANGVAGTANTGGGGGGGDTGKVGGKGGSGIVIVRYVYQAVPVVDNNIGATGVTERTVWLTGTLTSTGSAQTAWGVLWGTNNPGATMIGWLGGGATNLGAVTTSTTNASTLVSGLSPNTTYYYAYWATNACGTNLAPPTAFTTYAQWPSIANAPASGAWGQAATLNGLLLSSGDDAPTVYVYWGTNSAAWSYTNNIGMQGAGAVSNNVIGLTIGVTYYYQFYATNRYGQSWAPTTNSFSPLSPLPAITSTAISNITAAAATVYGTLSSTGEYTTVVYLFYGTTSGTWTFRNTVGASGVGVVSNQLNGLTPNTAYYYQFAASNAAGWAYAATNSFATAPTLGQTARVYSLWDPADYPALTSSLVLTGGTMTIDTGDGLTNGPVMTTIVGGVTNSYRGQVVPNQSSNVWLSLFSFGSVAISNAVSCTVVGSLGLALAAQGDMTIASTINLSGGNGSDLYQWMSGQGGPGGEAGVATNSFKSNPPDSNHGNGGHSNGLGGGSGGYGTGYGGGFGGTYAAGGGGYGGMGGWGTNSGDFQFGGTNYGDIALTNLYGGSGGGAAYYTSAGGGGGALELVANGTLTIAPTATLSANGGINGGVGSRSVGGGSGGGIILAANRLVVSGTVQANGGNGRSAGGGGGGGGRIALYAKTLTTNGTITVTGGTTSLNGVAGATGTIYVGSGLPWISPPGTGIFFF